MRGYVIDLFASKFPQKSPKNKADSTGVGQNQFASKFPQKSPKNKADSKRVCQNQFASKFQQKSPKIKAYIMGVGPKSCLHPNFRKNLPKLRQITTG